MDVGSSAGPVDPLERDLVEVDRRVLERLGVVADVALGASVTSGAGCGAGVTYRAGALARMIVGRRDGGAAGFVGGNGPDWYGSVDGGTPSASIGLTTGVDIGLVMTVAIGVAIGEAI